MTAYDLVAGARRLRRLLQMIKCAQDARAGGIEIADDDPEDPYMDAVIARRLTSSSYGCVVQRDCMANGGVRWNIWWDRQPE